MKFWMKKALVLACVGCSLMSPAYARVHGQDHTNQTVAIQPVQDKGTVEITPAQGRGELQPGQKQDVVDLAVNMDVDGIHPKYSNRVPESWHPMDSVNWQPGQQNSPQPLKRWPVKVSDNGGTLLFSDSPEYVEENGILYSDVVDGNGRIFYYHLNNTNQNKKIAVVMENQGKYTAVVHVSRQALNQPSDNYLWVGKTAQQQFMESQENRDIFVFAGRKKLLDKLRFTCRGKDKPLADLCSDFNKATNDGRSMGIYSQLLEDAIASIINVKDADDVDSFLSGEEISFFDNSIKGLDDFELICFLVVRGEQ